MRMSSRFTVALHIFACTELFSDEYNITSEILAGSIGTNPVVVRNILTRLKEAGLIEVSRGRKGGITILRPVSEITFYDIYMAVETNKDDCIFSFHENPSLECPVGRNIHSVLDDKLQMISDTMMDEMRRHTVQEVCDDMRVKLSEEIRNP